MSTVSRILSWIFLPLNAPVIALAITLYMPTFTPAQRAEIFEGCRAAEIWAREP